MQANGGSMSRSEIVRHVLRRMQPGRFVYAPNYWQWFAHHRHHGTLPGDLRHCQTQLDMIRHLGLDVFSRNVYCDQSGGWFGGLAETLWDGVEVDERRFREGLDTITERTYRTRAGTLDERLRYVFAESTLVQEQFLLDESGQQLAAFAELVAARRWRFRRDRFAQIRQEVGNDGIVCAGELFSPLKLLHFAAGADKAVFLLADHPEACRELMQVHESAQLDLVRQMIAEGVESMMAMDNLDVMFHPPPYVEQYSARFYEQAAGLCRAAVKKGTGPICRNGPEGAAHKLDLSRFSPGATFFIHACGHQRVLLPLVASLGVDGLEGVAFPPLGDVELDEAMRLAGDRLIITGGISATEFQRLHTRQDVFDYVRDLLVRLRPYAHRFMLAASCNTPRTASWETICHFRDAWREYGDLT